MVVQSTTDWPRKWCYESGTHTSRCRISFSTAYPKIPNSCFGGFVNHTLCSKLTWTLKIVKIESISFALSDAVMGRILMSRLRKCTCCSNWVMFSRSSDKKKFECPPPNGVCVWFDWYPQGCTTIGTYLRACVALISIVWSHLEMKQLMILSFCRHETAQRQAQSQPYQNGKITTRLLLKS